MSRRGIKPQYLKGTEKMQFCRLVMNTLLIGKSQHKHPPGFHPFLHRLLIHFAVQSVWIKYRHLDQHTGLTCQGVSACVSWFNLFVAPPQHDFLLLFVLALIVVLRSSTFSGRNTRFQPHYYQRLGWVLEVGQQSSNSGWKETEVRPGTSTATVNPFGKSLSFQCEKQANLHFIFRLI